jgi:type II secretion system protein G
MLSFRVERRGPRAFTLIELLATIAILAILAALVLGTLGYVNKKGAESRARSEVAALASAIDSFKLDFGMYPPDEESLYEELIGEGEINKGKLYIEPTAGIVDTNSKRFTDPWGGAYRYTTNATENVGLYDLWSTGGGASSEDWIRN